MKCLYRRTIAAAAAVTGVLASSSGVLSAQAFNYPSLQLPTVSTRDYTAAIIGANGTAALFQWREGTSSNMHLSLDAGLGDPRANTNGLVLFVGGGIGRQLARATAEQPLDVLLTGGAGVAVGGGMTMLRLPVGASVGHRFPLEGGVALTPYVHPRLSLDLCTSCGRRNNNNSELSLNFDLGGNLEITPNFAIRVAGAFSGSELVGKNGAFAVGVTWTPAALTTK